jgi:hypothetical protein
VYDRSGRLLGRVQMPKKAATPTAASSTATPVAVAAPSTPSAAAATPAPVVASSNPFPAGGMDTIHSLIIHRCVDVSFVMIVTPLPSPRGVTLPPGAQLGSDGHVYAGGKIIGKIAMQAPSSPSVSSLASPSTPKPSSDVLSPSIPTSSSSLAVPGVGVAIVAPSSPSKVDHTRNASDAIQLHMRTPSALAAASPSSAASPSLSSHARSPSNAAPLPLTPTSAAAAAVVGDHARSPSTGSNNGDRPRSSSTGNGSLPAGVSPATVPAGLRLPPNSTVTLTHLSRPSLHFLLRPSKCLLIIIYGSLNSLVG